VAFLVCFLGTHNSLPHVASGMGGVLVSATGLSSALAAGDSERVASAEYPLRSQLLHYLMPTSRPEVHGYGLGGLEALDISKVDSTGCIRMERGVRFVRAIELSIEYCSKSVLLLFFLVRLLKYIFFLLYVALLWC